MNTGNFTFEVLLTFVLPGLLVAVAILLLHGVDNAGMGELLKRAGEAQFLSVFVILSVIVLCGALVASLHAVVETYVLDRVTASLIGQSKSGFDQTWMAYVEKLPDLKNPYISRVVLFFQFETRLGLALLLLGVAILCSVHTHGWLFLILGAVIYGVGMMHHYELAVHRRKLLSATQTRHGSENRN